MSKAMAKEGWIWALWSQVRTKNKRRMRMAETLSLGGRRQLALVECDGRSFLVGCGQDAVHCILPLSAGAAVSRPEPVLWPAAEERES